MAGTEVSEPVRDKPSMAISALVRSLSTGAIAGALGGFVIGGVLGRFAMRLLALTSPDSAQGGITDDQAVVGDITLQGTVDLALFTTTVGGLGGLIYLWVRRILPESFRGRVLGYGIFTAAIGGALLLHEHGSFDYTVLTPAWLAVTMFLVLPLLFGVVVAAAVEGADRESGLSRRVPLVGLVVVALAVSWPAQLLTEVFVGVLGITSAFVAVSIAVVSIPALGRVWRSRAVTGVGSALFAVLVLWGVYGIVADIVSISTDRPWPLPFNP